MFCLILFVYVTLHLKYLKKLDCFIEYYFRALHCRWSRFAALFGATDSGKLRWRPQKERETDCQIIVIQHYRISKSSFILLCQKTFWWSKNSFFLFCEQWRLPLFPSHCYLFCRGECNGLSTCIFILITKTSQFTTCHLHLDLQLFFSSWEPYLNNVRKWL